jgi:exodeoxyribonuclease VII large subunit
MFMAERLTVTQLNTRVRSLLTESGALRDIWVTGEISNLKRYSSGHYYFTLKDEGSEVRAVMFKGSRGRIDFEPQENMKIAAFGHADLYVQRGSYQFIAETMQKSGIGDLYLEFEKLRKKLEAEGLFEQSRKRKLPEYPKVIGVVTSESGAVIHDIVVTSAKRFPADILLAPAKVQGDGAAESIVRGIEILNRAGADVLIVGRGGGSIEDLWAFNEEKVARAIAGSGVPVISAVGHESDFTIADMVADVRAPTPTGAAEIALRDMNDVRKQIESLGIRMNRRLEFSVSEMKGRLAPLASAVEPKRQLERLAMKEMQVDSLFDSAERLLTSVTENMRRRFAYADSGISADKILRRIELLKMRHASLSERLAAAIKNVMNTASAAWDSLFQKSEALSPYGVLERGYSYVTDTDGHTVSSVSSLSEGSGINLVFRDGRADAVVKKVMKNGQRN